MPANGDLARNPGICPDWESIQHHFDSQSCTQATEPHQPGLIDWLCLHCQLALFLELWSVLSFGPDFFVLVHLLLVRGEALGIRQGGATHVTELWCCMWGWGPRENNGTCSALSWLSDTSPTTHKQTRPFWCWFPGGWVCVHSRTLWVSPMNSLVRLGVSPATTTPRGFDNLRFWSFISPCWNPQLHSLSHSPVVPPGLSTHKCGTAWSIIRCLTYSGPPAAALPRILSALAVHVWMNVSSLTPWLSDFHTVQFSGSSVFF